MPFLPKREGEELKIRARIPRINSRYARGVAVANFGADEIRGEMLFLLREREREREEGSAAAIVARLFAPRLALRELESSCNGSHVVYEDVGAGEEGKGTRCIILFNESI